MKKVICILLSMLMILSLFTACGAKNGNGSKSSESSTNQDASKGEAQKKEESKEPVTINVIHWRSEDAEVYRELNKMFEDANPGIKVNMEITSSSNDDYYGVLKTRLMGGGKDLDVFATHPDAHFREYAQAGAFIDLTNEPFLKEINPGLLTVGTYEGKVYVIPQCNNVEGLFYNKDIFNKYGLSVPTTWPDFINTCQVLKDNGVEPISIGLADGWTSVWITIQLLNQVLDWDYFPKLQAGEVKFTDPVWVEILTGIQELGTKGFFQKNAVGTKYEQSITLFAQEKTAMLDSGTWSIGTIVSQNPDINMGYFIMPYPKEGVEVKANLAPSQSFGVGSKSEHQKEALKYLEFLCSKEAQEIYGNSTGQLVANVNAKLSSPILDEVTKLSQNASTSPHYNCTEPKISDGILFELGAKAILGEKIENILNDAQKQVDALIN